MRKSLKQEKKRGQQAAILQQKTPAEFLCIWNLHLQVKTCNSDWDLNLAKIKLDFGKCPKPTAF